MLRHLFAETKRRFGRVDIVVNNAAVNQRITVEHFNEEQYRQLFDANVLGLLLMAREAGKYLEPAGCILNISSLASTNPSPGSLLYGEARQQSMPSRRRLLSKWGRAAFASTRSIPELSKPSSWTSYQA